ncbi:MAG: LysM peptidoglycan-binding domain-containing protein [Myxococcota bacterium]
MKFARLAPVVALAFSLPTVVAVAEDAPPAAAAEAVVAETAPAAPAEAVAEAAAAAPAEDTLGPVGHDSQGRPGRIHVVQRGDTLWDISDAYLGTPWVWPSIWKDNSVEVENPHQIYPNERIWISPHEMRKVSDAEAAEMLARSAPEPEAQLEESMPAAMADPDGPEPVRNRGTFLYTEIQTTGFVTLEELEGAATIIGGPKSRSMFTDHTPVEIGLGEGEVAVGDELDVFRPGDLVVDPGTRRTMGRVTKQLGWLGWSPSTSRARARSCASRAAR